LEFFCDTCAHFICYKCAVRGGKHYSHQYTSLDEAFEAYKREITASLQPVEKQLLTVNRALPLLDARRMEVVNQQATLEADIHDKFRRLHEILEVRRTELVHQLHEVTQGKLKHLAAQRNQIETTQAQLSSCLDFIKENLKSGSQKDTLFMRSMVKKIKELITTQPDILKPGVESNIQFVASGDFVPVCKNYGEVLLASEIPDTSKCFVTGKVVAVVGENVPLSFKL